jgi:hypothetical protein
LSTDEHYIASIIELVNSAAPDFDAYKLLRIDIWRHAAAATGPIEYWPETYEDFLDRGSAHFHELITFALERNASSWKPEDINPEKTLASLSLNLVETPSGVALKVKFTPHEGEPLIDYVTPGRFTVELTPDKLSLKRAREINLGQVVVNRSEPS